MSQTLYTAIGFFPKEDAVQPQKFKNVVDNSRFTRFCQGRGFVYVNMYFKESRKFAYRKRLE